MKNSLSQHWEFIRVGSDSVGSNATTEGQAENRRVVRVLQNKGIAGT